MYETGPPQALAPIGAKAQSEDEVHFSLAISDSMMLFNLSKLASSYFLLLSSAGLSRISMGKFVLSADFEEAHEVIVNALINARAEYLMREFFINYFF